MQTNTEWDQPDRCFWGVVRTNILRIHQVSGAGGGDRTRIASLEGWNSTIELHPQIARILINDACVVNFGPCILPARMNSLLLTGGRVIDPANQFDAIGDVLILEGKVAALAPDA